MDFRICGGYLSEKVTPVNSYYVEGKSLYLEWNSKNHVYANP